MKHPAPTLAEMTGMWRRSLIVEPDGARDSSSQVRWLQGRTLFADLRQPEALPDFLHVRGLNDLRHRGLCSAFNAGRFCGPSGVRRRLLRMAAADRFSAARGNADAARLWWEEDILMEAGRDVAYVEYWMRDPTVVTRPLAAVQLRDDDAGVAALAIQVGTVFMFARQRQCALPAAGTLFDCVAGAGSLAAARAMLDCEVSLGSAGSTHVILASTHPWRVSEPLRAPVFGSIATTFATDADGAPGARRWQVTGVEGDPAAVWPASGPRNAASL